MLCAKVENGKVTKYPYIAKLVDYDKGIYPVVLSKPDTFRDSEEVWIEPLISVDADCVFVSMRKRAKTEEEKQAVVTERAALFEAGLADMRRVIDTTISLIEGKALDADDIDRLKKSLKV